jgi:hypothetical protein
LNISEQVTFVHIAPAIFECDITGDAHNHFGAWAVRNAGPQAAFATFTDFAAHRVDHIFRRDALFPKNVAGKTALDFQQRDEKMLNAKVEMSHPVRLLAGIYQNVLEGNGRHDVYSG